MDNSYKAVVSIDGSIGAGKSTIISSLSKNPNLTCLPEPVMEWTLLENFYKDKKAYAAPLQFEIILSQYEQFVNHHKNIKKPFLIIERSPSASAFVFSQMLLNDGYFDKTWWPIYKKLSNNFQYNIDFYIFLDVTPFTSLERIKRRDRSFERCIDLNYLQSLYSQYNTFYNSLPSNKCIKIDASEPLEKVIINVNDALCLFFKGHHKS